MLTNKYCKERVCGHILLRSWIFKACITQWTIFKNKQPKFNVGKIQRYFQKIKHKIKR